VNDENDTTEYGASAMGPEKHLAEMGWLMSEVVRNFLHETTPDVNFWDWLKYCVDVEEIVRRELAAAARRRAAREAGPAAPSRLTLLRGGADTIHSRMQNL
jgi:hypothetical protein